MTRNQRRAPRQQRSQEMVDRILAAAARVLAKNGYAGMNTNKVATEAEVSVGSLYRYFADKKEIFDALRVRLAEDVLTELTTAITEAGSMEGEAGTRHVIAALVGSFEDREAVARALINELPLGLSANTLPEIERSLSHFARMASLHLAPTRAPEDLDARSYLAVGITLSSCLRIALERPPHLDRDRLIDLVSETLTGSLST